MALFQVTAGPKLHQPVFINIGGTKYGGFITKVNRSDGTVNVSYLIDGQTALGIATSLKYDYTQASDGSWHYPEEYI